MTEDRSDIIRLEKSEARVKELEHILRRIRNSIAVASWNVKPEFKKWAAEVHTTIQAAVKDAENLTGQIEFLNDVVKERESWAARQLQTIKKLEVQLDEAHAAIRFPFRYFKSYWDDDFGDVYSKLEGYLKKHNLEIPDYDPNASKE